MAYTPDQQIDTGSFIPTTNVLDVARLYEVNVQSDEFKELLVRLYQTVNNIAIVLNNKESGYHILEEFVSGAVYFNPNDTSPLSLRPEFQKFINVGVLGAGTTTTAHGLTITSTWKFVSAIGMASDTIGFNYYPLPWASSAGATNIQVTVNATNVVIINNSGVSFTDCYINLKYLKY